MNNIYKGITFPFKVSRGQMFVDLTKTDKEQLRSKLSYLLCVRKGEVWKNPDLGCNLTQYIFEPCDAQTAQGIKAEIMTTIQRFLPSISVDTVDIDLDERTTMIGINIKYSFSDGVFKQTDNLSLSF